MGQIELATQLLVHCGSHVLEKGHDLSLDEYYFANGVYADMWLGNLGDRVVAAKVWRGASLSANSRQLFVTRLSKELDKWSQLQHPNIVSFIGVMACCGPLPALIFPHHENGNVITYLSKNPSADILHLLRDLASALSYMHHLQIVHGDIKGANVLVNDDGEACLTDIGAGIIPFPNDWTMGNRESARWMAPEVMDPGADSELEVEDYYPVTPQSDVYSFAMTTLEMFTCRLPFSHRRFYGGVVYDVIRGLRPPRPACPMLTDDMWTLMQTCWHQDPNRRPSIDLVLSWLDLLALMPR